MSLWVSFASSPHEGKLDEFKRLSAQCMEIVRAKDPGNAAVRHLPRRGWIGVHRRGAVYGLRSPHRTRREPRRSDGGDPRNGIVLGELLGEPSAEVRVRLAWKRGSTALHALAEDVDTAWSLQLAVSRSLWWSKHHQHRNPHRSWGEARDPTDALQQLGLPRPGGRS